MRFNRKNHVSTCSIAFSFVMAHTHTNISGKTEQNEAKKALIHTCTHEHIERTLNIDRWTYPKQISVDLYFTLHRTLIT